METKFFISPYKAPPSFCPLPFFLSCNPSPLQKPKPLSGFRLSFSSEKTKKTPFLGQSLVLRERYESRANSRTLFPVIRASRPKRRKELAFDNVIQRDKKLKLALRIRKILTSHPDRIMPLRELGKYRKALGLERKRRFIALLRKFPAVFEIVEEGAYSLRFKLTPEAERLYLVEMKIRNEMEELLVVKLRKFLMMSLDKRILLEKIAHLRTDFGLPLEFRDTICHRYPQYFRVVPTGRGPALELTHWDPELAVSFAELAEEENSQREMDEKDLIIDRKRRFNRVKLPKGVNLSKGELHKIGQFRDMPYISPYSDFSDLRSGTPQKEKHSCGVVHEILSLTMEKRTLVDHLTHFRDEFRFSQQLRGMLIRHPDMFYVSLKGDRDSVFLREAYRDSQLIEKNKMLLVKEKFRALVSVPRIRRINAHMESEENEQGDVSGEDKEGEWSDIDDDIGSDEYDDDGDEGEWSDDGGDEGEWSDDDGDEGEWSDDDDDDDEDVSPDFNDVEQSSVLEVVKSATEQVNGSSKRRVKKHLDPVLDGDNAPPDFNDVKQSPALEVTRPTTEQVNGPSKGRSKKHLDPLVSDGQPREPW